MSGRINESRRTIADGVDLVVTGPDVEPTDAVMAEVIIEMAAEAGGKIRIDLNDHAALDEISRRLRAKGVDPTSGAWLC